MGSLRTIRYMWKRERNLIFFSFFFLVGKKIASNAFVTNYDEILVCFWCMFPSLCMTDWGTKEKMTCFLLKQKEIHLQYWYLISQFVKLIIEDHVETKLDHLKQRFHANPPGPCWQFVIWLVCLPFFFFSFFNIIILPSMWKNTL